MTRSKTATAAIGLFALAFGQSMAQAQPRNNPPSVYVPPGAERPRFGGEFAFTQPGPVAGYWPSECYNWHLRANMNQSGPLAGPELNGAFHRFVKGVINNRPDYDDLSPGMTQAVRKYLPTAWASLTRIGEATVAKRIGEDGGNALYVLDTRGGDTHWNITVNPEGKIEAAFLCRGTGV